MKKSLVFISFVFIFLLMISSASAIFGWGNSNAVIDGSSSESENLEEGETTIFEDGSEVTITGINNEDGIVEGTITGLDGTTRSFALEEGASSTLADGSVLSVENIGKTWFGIGSEITLISLSSGVTRGELEGEDLGDEEMDFGGEFSCESGCNFLGEEEASVFLGEGTFLNGHTVDLDEEGSLILDGTYAYPPLEDGASYLVPIPTPDCHWEATFKDGELYMFTICECDLEEFAEEEFVE